MPKQSPEGRAPAGRLVHLRDLAPRAAAGNALSGYGSGRALAGRAREHHAPEREENSGNNAMTALCAAKSERLFAIRDRSGSVPHYLSCENR
jgi:hypothetical protein